MANYQNHAEAWNREWSVLLAKAIALAKGIDVSEPFQGDTAADQFIRAETINVPYMLYQAMLEVTRLGAQLITAMGAASAGDASQVPVAQDHLTRIDQLIGVLKALPALDVNAQADVAEQIEAVVARLNGRWPI